MTPATPAPPGPSARWSPTASHGATSTPTSPWPPGSGPPASRPCPTGAPSPIPSAFAPALADSGILGSTAPTAAGEASRSAPRGSTSAIPTTPSAMPSLDDLKRCLDWLAEAGGTHLVVHPGGLSDPSRPTPAARPCARGLHRPRRPRRGPSARSICVENMPPGVHPGSRMADLAALVAGLDRPEIGLALDTGHAHIAADPASETLAAGRWLRTTHVHDNNGRQDSHLPPASARSTGRPGRARSMPSAIPGRSCWNVSDTSASIPRAWTMPSSRSSGD